MKFLVDLLRFIMNIEDGCVFFWETVRRRRITDKEKLKAIKNTRKLCHLANAIGHYRFDIIE